MYIESTRTRRRRPALDKKFFFDIVPGMEKNAGLVAQLKGAMRIEREQGAPFIIDFPA